jgi:hypothetical protein
MPSPADLRLTVALVDDDDVVVMGVAQMLDPYRDRVVIAELTPWNRSWTTPTSCSTTPSHNQNPTTKISAFSSTAPVGAE